MSSPPGDIDLFVIDPPVGQEQVILSKIYEIVMKACKDLEGEKARLLVTRSAAAVTLFRKGGPPMQVILNTYSSVEHLLAGFDTDASCCAYVLSTGSFVVSPRGRRALEYRVNVMQSSRNSAAYAHRLEKYASRGFAIGLPGLDVSLLHPDLLSASYIRMRKKRDLLLRVLSTSDEDAPGVTSVMMPAGSKTTEVRCRKMKGKRVSGVQRLVVLSFAGHIRDVESPFVARSAASSTVVDAHNTEGALLLHCEERRDEYWLLWGLSTGSDDSDEEEDSGDMNDDGHYSITPQAKAVILFNSCLKRQSARLAREEPLRHDDWCFAGVMPKLSKTMCSSANTAKALADARVYAQLSRNEKISFVYDFCDANRTFASLNYVRDAAQNPLRSKISSEEFVQLYGLTKTLCFRASAERPVLDADWWGDLYGPQ